MDKELNDMVREEIAKSFDQWFDAEILMGRPRIITDMTLRTYPYTDLLSSYTNGVSTAMRIVERYLEEKEND